MRVCPTNIIQPAGLQAGLEGLWTPVLNFRSGTSGCQLNCIACGHVCPTAAIRPLSLEEKLGRGAYAARGPIRVGTAFVDRGRCLPWAMDKPCIVCQENCPVSPKAIYLREEYVGRRDGTFRVAAVTGDYFCRAEGDPAGRRRIVGNTTDRLTLAAGPGAPGFAAGDRAHLEVRLQRPHVDPRLCTGCGGCEHECPVSGRRAIRVSAENESRQRRHALTIT